MNPLNLPRPAWMTEDLVLLEEQADRFLEAEFVPHLEKWHEDKIYPREVWTKAGQAGLLCAMIPEEYGGAGGTFAHEAVINRAYSLAGFDAFGAPLHSGIVAPYILRFGTEEQKKRWLPKLATGELVGAIAMSEPGTGSDLQGVRTTAVKKGNRYVLNGSKTFITNGQHANLIVVVAKTDPKEGAKGVSLMVVETDDAPGFRRGRKLKKLGYDAADTSELFFEDVSLPAENLLGTRGRAGLRPAHEGTAAGADDRRLSRRGDDGARARAHHRLRQAARGVRQEDHRVPEHPVRARRMQDRGDRRQGVLRPLHRARTSKGELDTATASMAKYWPTDALGKVVDRCLQLFGGYGYMDEYPISRIYRDARVMRIYAGTNEIMKLVIARSL